MTGIVTSFISSKGGSGKTVTSSSLGTFLSALGYKVLLVDTDAATNGMTLLYLEQLLKSRTPNPLSFNLGVNTGLFQASEGIDPTIIDITERLHFVPATFKLMDTEGASQTAFQAALGRITRWRGDYDFIFLDAQAGTDAFARASVEVSDQSVIVSEYDPVSAQGIDRLKIIFGDILDPTATWVLFNKVLPEFAEVIGEGLAVARYLPPVPWDADVVRAFAARDLAISMTAPNTYTLAIAQVAYGLFNDNVGDTIENWRGEAFSTLTSPLKQESDKIQLLVSELEAAEDRQSSYTRLTSLAVASTSLFLLAISSLSVIDWQSVLPLVVDSAAFRLGLGGFGAIAAAGTTIALTELIRRTYRSSKREGRTEALENLRIQQRKLNAALQAAEGALKVSPPGFYTTRRRAQIKASQSNASEV